MATYYPLEKLRKIKGVEHAKYVDPYAGSKGNSMRYLSVAPRTKDKNVEGVDNLFCTRELSEQNAVRLVLNIKQIRKRISKLNLGGIFDQKLC